MEAKADWMELRDGDGHYCGRLNIRTLTLVLVGRKRNKVLELSNYVIRPQADLQNGACQPQENMIN